MEPLKEAMDTIAKHPNKVSLAPYPIRA
jgi:hypothetical protein